MYIIIFTIKQYSHNLLHSKSNCNMSEGSYITFIGHIYHFMK
jgi:hypothetical protein